MNTPAQCPECGADWSDGQSCENHFHQMLAWELEHQLYDVHHLMVLCYYLQHPTLYSPEGLQGAKKLLIDFVEGDVSTQQMRQRIKQSVDSGKRSHKIKGTPDAFGAYRNPIQWTMWASDVIDGGIEQYYDSARQWAAETLNALRETDNLDSTITFG